MINGKEWKSDITEAEAKFITKDKIDFIYENARGVLIEISDGNKVINNRSTLLLSYLSIMVALFAIIFFKDDTHLLVKILSLAFILEYASIIVYIWFRLLTPRLSWPINTEPCCLLIKDVITFSLDRIKFSECENLQERINDNRDNQSKKAYSLRKSLQFTFILPIVTAFFFSIAYILFTYSIF